MALMFLGLMGVLQLGSLPLGLVTIGYISLSLALPIIVLPSNTQIMSIVTIIVIISSTQP